MSATLSDRYIEATVRSLPARSQEDVRAELAAAITDAVEARVERGERRPDAERAVLTELGDPGVLAADYADRPLHLIGPRYYLTWWRLLKLLLFIVPLCAFGGSLLAQALAGAEIGELIGSSVTTGAAAVVHVAFWVTLVFVVLERTGAGTGVEWDVDQLPEPPNTTTDGRVDLAASLVLLGVSAGALLWDRFIGFVRSDGEALPVLDPGLWPWSVAALFAIMAGEAVLVVTVHVRRRWTTALAAANTALAVLFASLTLTLLARDDLVNQAFVEVALTENGVDADVLQIFGVLTAIGILGVAIWDVVDGWRKTAR